MTASARPSGGVLARGVAWVAILRWSAQIVTWLSTLVVVRFLSPRDYGVAGLAMTITAIAGVISEFGLGTAIITLKSVTAAQLAQFQGLALLLGAGITVLVGAGAPLTAWLLNEPSLRWVLPVLSLVFIAEALRVVPVAVLSRRLEYRMVGTVDLVRSVAGAVLALVLAVLGTGYWALVLSSLGSATVVGIWLIWREPRPVAWPRFRELTDSLRHAWHIVAARLAFIGFRNSDFLVIGRMLGSTVLGYYTVAWNVASLPGERLGNVITSTTIPFFGAIQHDRGQLRDYYVEVTRLLALIIFPTVAGLALVADLAVPLVLGPRWTPSIAVLRILCGYAGIQSVLTPVGQILLVTDRARVSMWMGMVAIVVFPAAFVAGAAIAGPIGVAVAWVVVSPVVASYSVVVAFRELQLPWRRGLAAFVPGLVGTTWMTLFVLLVRGTLVPGSGPVSLILVCLAGAAAYGVSLALLFPTMVRSVAGLVQRTLGRTLRA